MHEIKKLLKRSFDMWVKKRWLKEIDKCINRYNKSKDRAARDLYVLNVMIDEYNKLYHEDLKGGKNER